MSRLLLWTFGGFCVAAVVSVVAVWWLGCSVTQSHSLAVTGLLLWIAAFAVVLALTLWGAAAGNWLAGVLGAGALLVGSVCLLLDVVAFQVGGLCGGWNV